MIYIIKTCFLIVISYLFITNVHASHNSCNLDYNKEFYKSLQENEIPMRYKFIQVYHLEFIIVTSDFVDIYAQKKDNVIKMTTAFLKNKHLNKEGKILLIAHEIAHHYGKQQSIGWYSCEDMADYNAVRYILPLIVTNEKLNTIVDKGCEQLSNWYKYEAIPIGKNINTCEKHPSLTCRLSIFKSAQNASNIPTCISSEPAKKNAPKFINKHKK